MSEVSCNVVVEYGYTGEIKSIVDFPMRIYNIGMLQNLTYALRSKELEFLITRDGSNLPARLFRRAVLNNGRVNGCVVNPLVYTAISRLQCFIAESSNCTVRIYAHWAAEPDRYERFD